MLGILGLRGLAASGALRKLAVFYSRQRPDIQVAQVADSSDVDTTGPITLQMRLSLG